MNKKIYSLLAVFACLAAVSCANLLDQFSPSAISSGGVTGLDVPSVRIGMYNRVQNAPGYQSYMIFDMLGGDVTSVNHSPIEIINNYLREGTSTQSQWNGYYAAIFQVNNTLSICEANPDAGMSVTAAGEAHYFRALLYLGLVTRFGDVPILRKNTQEDLPRDPAADVWRFIDEELAAAKLALGTSPSYYYVSKDAVQALEARVRLYEGRNEEAAALAEELIKSGRYRFDSFSKIFGIDHKSNSEAIFAFMNQTTESNITLGNQYYPYDYVNKGTGNYILTDEITDLFLSGDNRKPASVLNVGGRNCLNKYPSGQAGCDPLFISRLGELYLISAEAQGYPAGVARLNELRKARGLGPAPASSPSTFLDAILKERRLELLGENHLFYDYVRTGRAVSALGIRETQQLFPLPAEELRLNPKLVQNPGY